MILIELTAAVDAAGTVQTFYVSTDRFVTEPTDTPANVAFLPILVDPGSLGVHAYADGRTGGATKLEVGEIVLANADGALDAWLNYSFDGRPVTIRSGTGGAYPGAFPAVIVGTVEGLEADWKRITIRLRDKQWKLELPALTTRYAGTNAGPSGLEGSANDLKGKVKPRVYGKVLNIAPPCVNTSTLIYQVSDRAVFDIPAVYDRGALLTKGADVASGAVLQTTTPAANTYITCKAEGLFRLGGDPIGIVTADVTQGAAAVARTAAQIIKQLVLDAGVSAGEISSSDVTALDAANSAVVGLFIGDESTSFKEAIDQVAASIGAWYGFDGTGALRMGRLSQPGATPVVTLADCDIGDAIERRPALDAGLPANRVTVNHTRYWTTQPNDVAGSVSAATKAALAQQYRSEVVEDLTVKTQWMLSPEYGVSGLLTSSSDAAVEAARLLALYKVRRDVFDVPVDISILTKYGLKLMDTVALQLNRFGMSAGKNFRLIGIRVELDKARAILTVWG